MSIQTNDITNKFNNLTFVIENIDSKWFRNAQSALFIEKVQKPQNNLEFPIKVSKIELTFLILSSDSTSVF